MQSEGISREFSLSCIREMRLLSVVSDLSDLTVSGVENPSSLALTAGSNLGAPLSESSAA